MRKIGEKTEKKLRESKKIWNSIFFEKNTRFLGDLNYTILRKEKLGFFAIISVTPPPPKKKNLKDVGHSFQKIYDILWSTDGLWRSRDAETVESCKCDQPTWRLTGVGARDAYASPKAHIVISPLQIYFNEDAWLSDDALMVQTSKWRFVSISCSCPPPTLLVNFNTEIQAYRNTEVQKYWNTELLSEVQKYRNSEIQKYHSTKILNYINTKYDRN